MNVVVTDFKVNVGDVCSILTENDLIFLHWALFKAKDSDLSNSLILFRYSIEDYLTKNRGLSLDFLNEYLGVNHSFNKEKVKYKNLLCGTDEEHLKKEREKIQSEIRSLQLKLESKRKELQNLTM